MKASTGLYSEKIADQILEHIADGGTIASACKLDAMPSPSTLRRWRRGEGQGVPEDFGERFEKALTIRLEGFVDDLLQIPRDIDPDHPGELQRARLECENRRWLLSKMLRTQFGERTAVDVSGQKENPLDLGKPEPFVFASEEARKMVIKAAHIEMQAGGGKSNEESRRRLQRMAEESGI
jgi:hypothetical protein